MKKHKVTVPCRPYGAVGTYYKKLEVTITSESDDINHIRQIAIDYCHAQEHEPNVMTNWDIEVV